MSIRPSFLLGFAFLAVLTLLASGPVLGAGTRRDLINRSGRDWRLFLVEGGREGVGKVLVLEKFSGKTVRTLQRVGDSVKIPAGAHYLLEFTYVNHYFFHELLLQDGHGHYVEYRAAVQYLSEPLPDFVVMDKHVGPPLDEASEAAVLRAVDDAIDTRNGNLIISQDFLCPEAARDLTLPGPGSPSPFLWGKPNPPRP